MIENSLAIPNINLETVELYKLRFEALVDIGRLILVGGGRIVLLPNQHSQPQDEALICTDLTLSSIHALISLVPDGHVMLQTIKPINEYTGERDRSVPTVALNQWREELGESYTKKVTGRIFRGLFK